MILGNLNVNSLRDKIEAVEELIRNNIDIFLFSETKLDEAFPNQQFKISGYEMFGRDMSGVLCFTSMKIFHRKQVTLKTSSMTVKAL